MLGFGVLVLALVLNQRYGAIAVGRIATDSMDVHADFDTFWRSADAFLSGGQVYDSGARLQNLNPPVWVLLTSPVAFFEPLEAYRVFALLMLSTMVASVALVADELRLRAGPCVLAAAGILLSAPMLATLALGQMYPILTLGLVGAWMFDRRGYQIPSGLSLGLVVALKPSLAPVVLWPLLRRRWEAVGAALVSGGAATLAGVLALGPETTLRWVTALQEEPLNTQWDNASLPATAGRLFTENPYVEAVALLPWAVPVFQVAGLAVVVFTARRVRGGSEWGLWALVAAALLASPIAWSNYLLLLAPAVLLLVARGYAPLALLLVALQLIPAQWPDLWLGRSTIVAALGLSFYSYVLISHWLAVLPPAQAPAKEAWDPGAASPDGRDAEVAAKGTPGATPP